MRLQGRVGLITGGSSGVGRAIALRFAREGASVIVSDLREEPIGGGKPTAAAINEEGGIAEFIQADVTSSASVDNLVAETVSRLGRVDIATLCAARFDAAPILETTDETWKSVMAVNLDGVFFCCRSLVGQMLGQPPIDATAGTSYTRFDGVRGKIIVLASLHGLVGQPQSFPYSVSKGALVNLTHQLAVDYAQSGIIVNAISPGRILTGTHGGDHPEHPADPRGTLDFFKGRTPYPRLGLADDVAGAALYLASDDCSFVAGTNLLVDGGWMAN